MASVKPYDPIVSIEGMYHGSVTRIAYALKDPGNFGQSTKGIIQECPKQFHEALDDCEIQILDAKWYLEHQLQVRKEQRAAKAREEQAASAKRKHDQVEADAEKDQESKRQRTKPPSDAGPDAAPAPVPQQEPAQPNTVTEQPSAPEPQKPATPEKQPTPPQPAKQEAQEKKIATPPKTIPVPEKPPETDDLFGSGRPTPSADPGTVGGAFDGADDFISGTFESMFGEATADDGNTNTEGDFPFDQPLGGDAFATDVQNPNIDQNIASGEAADLNSLLPGLENYANQDAGGNGAGLNNASSDQAAGLNASDFDLPTLDGPNDFDAFLNENNFDGMDMGNDPNMEGDLNNMDAPLDFDSMFS